MRAAKLTPLTAAPQVAGTVAGAGRCFLLKDTGQEGLLEARYALAASSVAIAEHAFSVDGTRLPGRLVDPRAQSGLAAAVRDAAARLGLDFAALAAVPRGGES